MLLKISDLPLPSSLFWKGDWFMNLFCPINKWLLHRQMVSPSNFQFKKANIIEFLFLNPSNLKNRMLQPTKCMKYINKAIWKPDSTLVFTCTKHFNGMVRLLKKFPYNRFLTQIKRNPHRYFRQERSKNYNLVNNCGMFWRDSKIRFIPYFT